MTHLPTFLSTKANNIDKCFLAKKLYSTDNKSGLPTNITILRAI